VICGGCCDRAFIGCTGGTINSGALGTGDGYGTFTGDGGLARIGSKGSNEDGFLGESNENE
jgi:hypothetical protein